MRTDETVSAYRYIPLRVRPVRRIVPFMFTNAFQVMLVGNGVVKSDHPRSSIAQLVRACGC